MNTLWRSAIGLMIGLALTVAMAGPASAEPKHVLITQKVQLMATVGKASLQSHVGAIVANIEEQFPRP